MIIWKIFRWLFMILDSIVYQIVTWMYNLFIDIAETGLFHQETIQTFASRIYALLGVFMLFKVTFSLITYIFNPDDLTDKTKGASKLLTNFFIVLIGIISVPYIFTAAFQLQGIVLRENLIGNLIMGMSYSGSDASNQVTNGGENMSFTVLSAFVRPNPAVAGTTPEKGKECNRNPIINGSFNTASCDASFWSGKTLNNGNTLQQQLEIAYGVSSSNGQTNYRALIDWVKLDLVTFVVSGSNGDEFAMDYTMVISTIAGGFLAWILLIFCIDIAVRSVKLGFLQLIAPIPIISYIDPKSGKDGMFSKWVKNCTSTFADLFIRLVAIYFAIFIISQITNDAIVNLVDPDKQPSILVVVFIIFGALMFAKQVPQLISDLTGIKLSGGFTLNPMKKLGAVPLVGGAAAAGLAYGKNLGIAGLGAGASGAHRLARLGLNKVSGGVIPVGGKSAAEIGQGFSKRMDAARLESKGRFSSSGFAGSDKYSGDTAAKILGKERDEKRNKAGQAKVGLKEQRVLWNAGKASMKEAPDLNTATDYKKAGFKNESFINSKMAIKKAEDDFKLSKVTATDTSNTYQAMVNRLNNIDTSTPAGVIQHTEYKKEVDKYRDGAYKTAQEEMEKRQKAFTALEDTHKNFIAPQNAADAELDLARKIAKGPKPGEF